MPHSAMTIQKRCRGGVVVPWRNTLAKSKQKRNAAVQQRQLQKWCRGGVVASWRNTFPKSKQKH